MYEYQRRLINEAAKFGPLSPKEKANLPKACLNEEIVNLGEGFSAIGGAQKATVDAGLSVSTYRNLLSRLQKFPGHALVLDITTPTGPGAARGGLTGEGSEIKVVKIADIGKYELMGYKFPSLKPGAKAQRTWPDHKGEATILAINESVQEEVENLDEESEFKQNAKYNFDVSTKLAKKKDADHNSQWGVGFRAYCRAVISGNAINMDPPKEPGLKSGWNDARQMIAMGRRLKEEVENLEEMTGKEAAKILSGVRKVKVVKPTSISSQMKVGSTYQLTSAGAHINPSLPGGDKKYRLVTGSSDMGTRTQTGAIISTNLAKAIKRGEIEIVKEEVEDLSEDKAVPISRGSSTGVKAFTINGRKIRVDADQSDKNKYHVATWAGSSWNNKGTITSTTEPTRSQVIDTIRRAGGSVGESVENIDEGSSGNSNIDKYFAKLPAAFIADVKKLGVLHPASNKPSFPAKPVDPKDRLKVQELMTKHGVRTMKAIEFAGKPYSEVLKKTGERIIRNLNSYLGESVGESVEEVPVSEGVMKDEIMKFLFAMPKQASDEIAQLSKKMGGLKPNTTTETAVKAILVKHKVKLLKDMEWSLKAVIHFFDDMMEEQVSEAYAPQWAYARQKQHPILGRFYYKSNLFEYRAIVKGTPGSDWALSHGMTHEVFLKPVFGDHRDSRFAIIKATVAQVAVDEGEGGKPTYEKWPITRHTKYEDHPSNPTGFKKYG